MQGIKQLFLSSHFKNVYSDIINQVAIDNNMTTIELDVLLFLANNPEYDTAKEIVQHRNIAKSYVSKAVDLLIKRDFLSAYVDENDHRLLHLKINDVAQPVIKQGQNAQKEFVKILHRNISEEDLKVVRKVIAAMVDNLKKYR